MVTETVKKLIGDVEIEYKEERPGDFEGKKVSAEKAKKELGWEPKVDFEDGMTRYIEGYKESAKKKIKMKLNICMLLLPLRYSQNMRVNPKIGICSYLTNFGHKITWVILSEKHRRNQQFLFKGTYVYSAPYIHYFSESSLLGKIFNLTLSTFRMIYLILKIFRKCEDRYDIILVRVDVLMGLLAFYIKLRYKIPFVYEIINPPEHKWEGCRIEAKKPKILYYLIAKLSASMEMFIMKRADLVLPTTKWFAEALVKKGISKSKLLPHPNGVDIESFFKNRDGKAVREKYHLANSKIFIYLGTMDKARYLGLLIKAFWKVKKETEDVKLLMVGEGSDRENRERLAEELGIKDDVIFTGQVAQSEVPNYIAAADVGVSPIPSSSFYKVSSPIKMLEYMAMGKPVVANDEIPEQEEIIRKSGGGILVKFEYESFANGIIELLDNPDTAREMGKKGQKWIMKNRTYEILARRLEEKYFDILSS
jgi:glycosyltransferase involved in cell wall biosynthesis